jgi:acetyl-CoA C-acetyltransferase
VAVDATHEERTPVLVGAGQLVQRDVDPREALSPVDMMVDVARRAAEDARLDAGKLEALDAVVALRVLGGGYADAARLLAERLGAASARTTYTPVGGNTGQKAVNETARAIVAGRGGFTLVAAAEALDTRRRGREAGVELDWTGGGPPAEDVEPERPGSSPLELRYRLAVPPFVYPLFENALRARYGRDVETHQRALGALMSRFSAVAAANPYAWFRTRRDPDEIARPGPSNRMVAFPYTKYMNAILRVDQAAAVLVTSLAHARSLGVPDDRVIHWLGGGDADEEPWFVTERPDLSDAYGMRRAYAEAFAEAHLCAGDVHAFDLYSCFPCAVEMGCDALGIPPDDPRPLTVTGGLPYAGGPGNGYTTQALAAMVGQLRVEPGTVGMVTGVGWYLSKHSAGLFSTLPRVELPSPPALSPEPPAPEEHPALVESAEGRGRIETYTVLHDRDGEREWGVVVGRLEDDRRFLACLEDEAALRALETAEGVGRSGRVRPAGDLNRFELD